MLCRLFNTLNIFSVRSRVILLKGESNDLQRSINKVIELEKISRASLIRA